MARVKVRFLVDSGATVNIIPMSVWQDILKARRLNKEAHLVSDIMDLGWDDITAYGGSKVGISHSFCTNVEVIGSANMKTFASILVVKEESQAILSKKTSEELRILKVGPQVNTINIDEPVKLFPCIPNKLVHLEIDESVTPVQNSRVRVPVALEESVKLRIGKMLDDGIIEKAQHTNSFVSPMHVVAKGSGDFRIVIDMRAANKAIKRKFYPLPIMENLLQNLAGTKFFTSLDLTSAYHQVQLHPDSRYVTTFMSPQGPMQFTRLVFGMNAAPELFQEAIEEVLKDCDGATAYLDDILIVANSLEELRARTTKVEKALKDNNLMLNREKCQYEKESIEFLGFRLDKDGVHPTKEKLETINSFKRPKDIKELKSFLGCVSFLGAFVENMATVLEPLRKLTRSNENFDWNTEQEAAFVKIKELLINNAGPQAFFKNNLTTKLYTDASGVGLGAVLTQVQADGKEVPITFASKTLTKAERAYPQIQREALAIVWAMEKFDYYLLGREFIIVTDNNALKQIYGQDRIESKRAAMRFEGWQIRLAPFRFKTEFIAGKDNVVADALSRLCATEPCSYYEKKNVMDLGQITPQVNALMKEGPVKTIRLEAIAEYTKEDEHLQTLIKALATNNWSCNVKAYKPFAAEFYVKSGIIMRNHQIVLPQALHYQALRNAHVAHSGIVVMKRSLRSRVWWMGMDKDVTTLVVQCPGCTAVAKDEPPEPMIRTKLPARPMELIAIDHWSASTIPVKLFVVSDYFSRYLWYQAVKDVSSKETIKACSEIFSVFGKPVTIRADNGTAFSSDEFKSWCKNEDIVLDFSTPLWPQQNGQVENVMKFINKVLRIDRIYEKGWESALKSSVEFYNNERIHTTTGVTPSELMFGRRLRASLPLITEELNFEIDDIRERDQVEKEKGKVQADERRHARESTIKEGDSVFMRSRGTDKLAPRFDVENPCVVVAKNGAKVVVKTPDGNIFERNITAIKKNCISNENEGDVEILCENNDIVERGEEDSIVGTKRLRDRATIKPPIKLSLQVFRGYKSEGGV